MAYTTIDDPSAFFQTATYTGAGANTVVTNGGNSDLKPDLLWIKNRTASYAHFLVDSNRNISYEQNSSNAPYLETDSTTAENSNQNWMQSVNTDGFTTGISEHINNNSGSAYVAWQWKANGGTTVSNTEGNVTNTLQVNQDAGFSISKFTSIISGNTTIGHGLGVTPDVFIVKIASGTGGWWMNHKGLTNQSDRYVGLQSTQAETTLSWGAAPTSTLITAAPGFIGNGTTTVMCYAFAEKQGYSKFGKYVGNGNANGPFVYTGFKPAFVLIKRTDSADNWFLYDTKRSPFNEADEYIRANIANAEGSNNFQIDMLSNGFKTRNSGAFIGALNASGGTYIYMAFAENPFVTSTGVPTTAR